MELAFNSKLLRTICESESRAKHELGDAVAEMLKHRLADLRAATSVKDLMAGRPRTLRGTPLGVMVVDLRKGYRLVFAANHARNPMKNGDVDWEQVSRIKIIRIECEHGH